MSERDPGWENFVKEMRASGELADNDIEEIEKCAGGVDAPAIPEELKQEPNQDAANQVTGDQAAGNVPMKEGEDLDLRTKISKMGVPQKVKLAMFGNSTCRNLLVMDPNRLVHLAVLRNPRLRLPEIEDMARNPYVSEFVLRQIASTTEWMRTYKIKANIVGNPKTPGDISLKWVRFMNATDLKRLSKSKQVPNIVAISARKRLAENNK